MEAEGLPKAPKAQHARAAEKFELRRCFQRIFLRKCVDQPVDWPRNGSPLGQALRALQPGPSGPSARPFGPSARPFGPVSPALRARIVRLWS